MADPVITAPAASSGGMAGIMDQLKGWLADNPRLGKSLMAGLGSAATAGGLTAMSKRKNETPAERRKRILRNALLAGGAGAGAVGLGDYALGQFKTVDPVAEDPVLNPMRELAAVGGGALGLGASRAAGKMEQDTKRRSIIGGVRKELEGSNVNSAGKRLQDIASTIPEPDAKGGVKRFFTGGASAGALKDMMNVEGKPGQKSPMEQVLKRRGVTAKDLTDAGHVKAWAGKGDTKRFAKDILGREVNKTLGRGKMQRAGRLGAIGASAAVPYALVSALMNKPQMADNTIGRYTDTVPSNGSVFGIPREGVTQIQDNLLDLAGID